MALSSIKEVPIARIRIPLVVVVQALVLVGILAVADPLLFLRWGVRLRIVMWVALGVFNFVFFVAMILFFRWFKQVCESWDKSTLRRVRFILLAVGLLLISLALLIST
jgi:Na+/proline symporter